MSTLMDGINNIYALNAQINSLQSLDPNTADVETIQLTIERNFSKMLDELMAASNDDDDDENTNPFSFFISSQSSLQSLQSSGTLTGSDDDGLNSETSIINSLPDTGSPEYLNSLYNLNLSQLM